LRKRAYGSRRVDCFSTERRPRALWRDRIVLSVHHDGTGAMPTEWKLMTDRLVHDILFGLTGTPPQMMTQGAEYRLTQNWIQATAT
jgi:hypothetical protein